MSLLPRGLLMNSDNEFRLLVSIVNYNSARLVCEMLPSLIEQLINQVDKVVIVDNKSSDDSAELIQQFIKERCLHEQILFIASDINGGFSFGNNLAIKEGIKSVGHEPKYVLLLNPDAKPEPGAIESLITFAEQNPQVGLAGSQLLDENGNTQRSAFTFHSIMSELLSSLRLGILDKYFSHYLVSSGLIPIQPTKIDWLAGASMLIRYQVIRDIGFMDENYFLYFEETDYCLQAKLSNWECWYVPQSKVIHLEGQSTGVVSNDKHRRRRPQYWFESRQYYFIKNHGRVYLALADLIWITGFTFRKFRYFLQRKKNTEPKLMLFDFCRNSIFFSWINKN